MKRAKKRDGLIGIPEDIGPGPAASGSSGRPSAPGKDAESFLAGGSDPASRTLAKPELPPLDRRNRAWLQIQSPNRLFFYWSVKSDPIDVLRKAFGPASADYRLVVKLIELETRREESFTAGAEGDWWFEARPDRGYRAEVGFESSSRPYVRVVFSNEVRTPRRGPSPRPASESEWAVSSELFSRMLEDAGYIADAIDTALCGDDGRLARERTVKAYSELLGTDFDPSPFDEAELRLALLLLSAGMPLDLIAQRISGALFRFLMSRMSLLSKERAKRALLDNFEVEEEDFAEEPEFGPEVYGASRVHMPVRIGAGARRLLPRRLSEADRIRPSSPSRRPGSEGA